MGTRTPVRDLPDGRPRDALEELRATIDRAQRHLESVSQRMPAELRGVDRAGKAVARLLDAQQQLERATAELHLAQRRVADAVRTWRTQARELEHAIGPGTPRAGGAVDAQTGPTIAPAAIEAVRAPLPPISIATFGRFEVRRDGAPIRLCASKSGQAILRYLASHPQRRESMDALMDLLWPGDPPKAARHKLHIAFSALRTSLTPEDIDGVGPEATYVRYADGAYELNPGAPITIDLEVFFSGYRAGQRAGGSAGIPMFEAACGVVVGTFLPEDLYTDWAILRRESVASAFRTMAHSLAEHYAATSRLDDAAEWASRLLAENRTDEAAHRLLMRIHIRAGRRAEALQQYRLCVHALSEDLGIGPMPETTRLYQGVLEGRADPESPLLEPS